MVSSEPEKSATGSRSTVAPTPSADGYSADDCSDDEYADDDPAADAELRAVVAGLGLDELHPHRLALPSPLGAAAEPDLIAALSELVGFDPEPGVQCLAPVPLPNDPARTAIERAVWQISQVYSLPVQRYRCLELSVVDDRG